MRMRSPLVSVDHPSVSQAVEDLRQRGIPTFGLLTGLTTPAWAGYVGIDNRKAGRLAAWTIARTAQVPGEVGILVGSHRYLGHEMREIGFRSYFREHAPSFRVLEAIVNLEEPRIAYEATLDLLKKHPESRRHLCRRRRHGGRDHGAAGREARRDLCRRRQRADARHPRGAHRRHRDAGDRHAGAAPGPDAWSMRCLARSRSGASQTPIQTLLPFEIFTSENF